MPYYAMLIQQKTEGLMDCIWGFIDGTIRRTARPLYHQQSIYTCFKKCHGVKLQSVTVLEGFILPVYRDPGHLKHMMSICYMTWD